MRVLLSVCVVLCLCGFSQAQSSIVKSMPHPVTYLAEPSEFLPEPAESDPVPGPDPCLEALAEVNAARAARGLAPFQHDPQLAKAAMAAARYRAQRQIHGHVEEGEGDFQFLPAGTNCRTAGCGALEPSWGWGTCCTYDNYSHAGAAWVMGQDGRRYMHLFVRDSPGDPSPASCSTGQCSQVAEAPVRTVQYRQPAQRKLKFSSRCKSGTCG